MLAELSPKKLSKRWAGIKFHIFYMFCLFGVHLMFFLVYWDVRLTLAELFGGGLNKQLFAKWPLITHIVRLH